MTLQEPNKAANKCPENLGELIARSKALLSELHNSLAAPVWQGFGQVEDAATEENSNSASMYREAIFYAAESAYSFQYRELTPVKYANDQKWLLENKQVDIQAAVSFLRAVLSTLESKHASTIQNLAASTPNALGYLDAFLISPEEIAAQSDLDVEIVRGILDAFCVPPENRNGDFHALSDFNVINAYPIIPAENGKYLLFQYQSLTEAFYETPYFWMAADEQYKSIAFANRGNFAEEFSEQRFQNVFGPARVFRGLRIEGPKGKTAGEVDVLVLYADMAIIAQAKSKRLTIEARKGNGSQLKLDFKKAIQDAADQAASCAKLLLSGEYRLIKADGSVLHLTSPLRRIYPLCLVADHYPSLTFQTLRMLSFTENESVAAPLITDIFALDAIAEMLESPLRFLSYLELRAKYGKRLLASHEFTILSYHLKRNLWMDPQYSLFHLGDDIAADLDAAMAVRREGLPGSRTPDGILTRFQNTEFERILEHITAAESAVASEIGFLLLEMGEDTVSKMNAGVRAMLALAAGDGKGHDFTVGVGDSGITFHCNSDAVAPARLRLRSDCEARKYLSKAGRWFGVLLAPDGSIRAELSVKAPWTYDSVKEEQYGRMRRASPFGKLPQPNERCHCGSGKKFKKCCRRQ